MDRLPPHSSEAEAGILGCCLLEPDTSIGECIEHLPMGGEVFYDVRHRRVYECMVAMYDEAKGGTAIDVITVSQKLKDEGGLEQVGGMAVLSKLPDVVPSANHLAHYLQIVRGKYILRQVIRICSESVGKAYEEKGEQVDALVDGIERDILKISEERASATEASIKSLMQDAVITVESFFRKKGEMDGVPSGYPDLDRLTGGFQDGDMIIVAARPSMGKTSIALNIAEHVAVDKKIPVGVFSLEMTAKSLALRLLCSRSRVCWRSVREGFMSERDFPKMVSATGQISAAPLYIDDSSGLSVIQLRAKARRMVRQHKIKLLVIDYLQLLHSTNRRAENRQQEIADISGGIKALAKELNIPIILLSQLNREMEKEKDRKPRLSDLRESGAIEQDADVVLMLYDTRTREERDGDFNADTVPAGLLVAKHRSGPTGDIKLTFFKSHTRFESAAKVSVDDGNKGVPIPKSVPRQKYGQREY